MIRLPIPTVGVSFWLAVLVAMPDYGFAQSVPGYRMRLPTSGSIGASVRAPRLTGITPTIADPRGEPFRRRFFFPDNYFGWYFVGSDGYGYPDDSAGATYPRVTETARAIYPVYDTVPDVGPLEVSVKQVASRTVVQLAWRNLGVAAQQVAFFLADSARAVLSAQTVRSPPFTALFEPPLRTAFAGMTVVLADGNLVTQFVPYRRTR